MPRVGAVVLLLLVALAPAGRAQRVVVGADSLARVARFSDTLRVAFPPPYRLRPFVRPGTVEVVGNGVRLDTSQYRLDARRGVLRLTPRAPYPLVQLVVRYETEGYRLADRYRLAPDARARADTLAPDALLAGLDALPAPAAPTADGAPTLRRSGSITRGVLAGSNRDVAIESGLRVQVDGEVAPGVRVEAALTDANTPILAEGTTQRLSDFDRVYLAVETKGTTTRLGDVDLALDGPELARLQRKVQGGATELRFGHGRGAAGGRVVAFGAVPRGLFRLQPLVVLEGVQGPYRLEGAAGEPYVLVVPGSEVVYLNGERLTRDRDGDYTIEYATGEVTFTPRRLLRATDRVTVEFQYTATGFPRSLTGGRAELGVRPLGRALALGATVLREADGLDGGALDLSAADDSTLRASGDGLARRSGATRLARYDPEAPFVQYGRTVVGVDTVFVALDAAPPADAAVFRVVFSRVGSGGGAYTRAGRTVNGIAYTYVGPGQGEYDPVRVLPKPAAKLLGGLDARLRLGRGVEAFGEWAGSRFDENRLSALDEADDAGQAYVAGLRVDTVGTDRRGLAGGYVRRWRAATFVAFDRTRPVEFDRRWNLTTSAFGSPFNAFETRQREATDEATLRAWAGRRTALTLEAGRISLGDAFRAQRAAFDLASSEPRLADVRYRLDAVASDDRAAGIDGRLVRGVGEAFRRLGRWAPGLAVEHEWRTQRVAADSLAFGSRGFVEARPGVGYGDVGRVELVLRREYEPLGGALLRLADGAGVQTTYRLAGTNGFQADGRAAVRRRRFTGVFADRARTEETSAVSIGQNLRWTPLRRAADVTLAYTAQTERTPRLQEVFVRVGPDLAEARYVWDDRDGDGARDLDEFVPEASAYEGEYARTFVPTDTLVGVAGVAARVRVGFEPGRLVGPGRAGWRRLARGLALRTTLDVDEKSRDASPWRLYVLDLTRFQRAGTTVSGRLRLAQDVSVFRDSPRGGLDLAAALVRSRSALAGGDEARRLLTLTAAGRYRVGEAVTFRLTLGREASEAESDRFAARRYRIETDRAEGALAWAPASGAAVSLGAEGAAKRDAVENRRAWLVRAPLDVRWSRPRRFVASGTVEAAYVRLRGDAVGEAAFELTDGRGPGTSFLWNANVQAALSRVLTLTLGYDGRAPEGAPVVHTLRAQVGAAF